MNEENRKPGESEVHRKQRGKNLALLAALVGFCALVYVVALVRMGGNW
jgi:hypothetical protein